LSAGVLVCPEGGCGGVLAPWGWARPRVVFMGLAGRDGSGVRVVPRRVRCRVCQVTQVLLPDSCLSRRMDGAPVVGFVLALVAGGGSARSAARLVGRPRATVRGWVLAGRGAGSRLAGRLAGLSVSLGVDPALVFTAGAAGPLEVLVAGSAALAAALAARWPGWSPSWVQAVLAACRCRVLEAGRAAQHEPALMRGPPGGALLERLPP
jgi:hypothetical protein